MRASAARELDFRALRFVAVGHVTNDRLAQGQFPGGSALYAALTAAKLGASARVVTSFGPDFTGVDLLSAAGIELEVLPSLQTTTFTAVDTGEKRSWVASGRADQLHGPIGAADIVFACPVLAEVDPSCLQAPPPTIVAAGLQGWLRAIDPDGRVNPVEADLSFLRGCQALFCSEEDVGDNAASVVPRLLESAPTVVVTEGSRGAVLYLHGRPHRVLALPTSQADPTGAGDTFATCFLLALASGMSALEAAVVGACGASAVVEAPGPLGIERLSSLPERVAWYRSHLPAPVLMGQHAPSVA